ncbi:hypothetical protein ACWGB8_30105 [Kitasatospora sp. NPDC054939]
MLGGFVRWLEGVLDRGWRNPTAAVQVLGADGEIDRSVTYGDLLRSAVALAARIGPRPGEWQQRVAIFALSGPEYVVADLAALIAGAVVISAGTAAHEAPDAETLCGAALLMADRRGRAVLTGRYPKGLAELGCEIVPVEQEPAPVVEPRSLGGDLDDVCKVLRVGAPEGRRRVALTGIALERIMRSPQIRRRCDWRRYHSPGAPLSQLADQVNVYHTLQHGGTVVFPAPRG